MAKLTEPQRYVLVALSEEEDGQLRRARFGGSWTLVRDNLPSARILDATVRALERRGFLSHHFETVGRVEIRRITPSGRLALQSQDTTRGTG